LANEGATPEIRAAARVAAKTDRNARYDVQRQQVAAIGIEERLVIKPQAVPLPPPLRQALAGFDGCTKAARCVLFYQPGAANAVLVGKPWSGASPVNVRRLRAVDGVWSEVPDIETVPETEAAKRDARQAASLAAGQVEIRTVETRQVFVGGEAVGQPFE
jgi:hypothetical protein